MSIPKEAETQNSPLINFPARPGAEGKPAEAAPPKRDFKYLWIYAIGIFSVAIVLMLLSFLSQSQRAEQQHLDFSSSALKSIETMKSENDSLMQENADLNLAKNALLGQISDLQQQLNALLESNDALRAELGGTEVMLSQSISQYEELIKQLEQQQSSAEG